MNSTVIEDDWRAVRGVRVVRFLVCQSWSNELARPADTKAVSRSFHPLGEASATAF